MTQDSIAKQRCEAAKFDGKTCAKKDSALFNAPNADHLRNVVVLSNFKVGDRVEWNNTSLTPMQRMAGEVLGVANLTEGVLRVRLEGTATECQIGARLLANVTADEIDIPKFLRDSATEGGTPQHEPAAQAAAPKAEPKPRQKAAAEKTAGEASAAKGERKP